MAFRFVKSATQNALRTVACGFKRPFEHAYVLGFVFLFMLLPAVAKFVGVVVADSAPVYVV